MPEVASRPSPETGRLSFGIAPPNWGPFGDPRAAADLARAAEESGWDGYFCWDALPVRSAPPAVHDPWVILSSVATATSRIRIGTCIAVVPRYPPHVLARTLVSLDVLSNGRLILGVGIGTGGAAFDAFGEPGEARVRAERLDEALDVITRLWSGEEVNHRGEHYVVEGFTLAGRPVQRPRIPIWVGGDSGAALRRAARWDGWIGPDQAPDEATRKQLERVSERLTASGAGAGSDIAWAGPLPPTDSSVAEYREAGATWWIVPALGSRDEVLARIAEGPPRTDLPEG